MTSALTPEQALEHLLGLSADIRDGVVVDPGGRRLAGSRVLAGAAQELLEASDASEIEVGTVGGMVFAARSEAGAIVVVADRTSLPAVMLYDLRMTLLQMQEAP